MLFNNWQLFVSYIRQDNACRRQIDGLVQERRNSIANALELRLSCINPSKCAQW